MQYPLNQKETLSPELFRAPTGEYRAVPFWGWNGKLEREELLRQIDVFKAMGFGGFVMHPRVGLATEYLSSEFLDMVRVCVDKARNEKMTAWLYDEDRYPSGACAGRVTENPEFQAKHLLFTCEGEQKGVLFATYDVELDEAGRLVKYARTDGKTPACANGIRCYAFLCVTPQRDEKFAGNPFADEMNPDATKAFLQLTHEKYKQTVGGAFGGAVPAVFTDEPNVKSAGKITDPVNGSPARISWTADFAETYASAYGADVFDTLPELFWDRRDGGHTLTRWRYYNHKADRFSTGYCKVIGDWCGENGIDFTGHVLGEGALDSQTDSVGEAMRCYAHFQRPGVDMLMDRREYLTVLQAASVVRQMGREGLVCELDGVTDFNFDFRGRKLSGDWQAALGVTTRVPHYCFYTYAGEAKRDYPPSFGDQSPWWKQYHRLEDHFARVATAMTRGKPVIRIGVIHPIESSWLYWGQGTKNRLCREACGKNAKALCDWLQFSQMHFDWISEALLPSLCPKGGAPLTVGAMQYDAILVPDAVTLRAATLARLEAFSAAGGKLIFAGRIPELCDAVPSDRGRKLAEGSIRVAMAKEEILAALEDLREISLMTAGKTERRYLTQLRADGAYRWLFVARGTPLTCPEERHAESVTLTVRGLWKPELYDTLTGEIRSCPFRQREDRTEIPLGLYAQDSVLLRLSPESSHGISLPGSVQEEYIPFRGAVSYSLDEPNALLLDMAEYAVDDGVWQPTEEVLRVDDGVRKQFGFGIRGGGMTEPWRSGEKPLGHTLHLRYTVESEVSLENVALALERPEKTTILWNGEKVAGAPDGFYVDRGIKTVPLPGLRRGTNRLELSFPMETYAGAEWCRLLGGFGVRVAGASARIVPLPERLTFSDICGQGLPFYSGNVTYHIPFTGGGAPAFKIPMYRGALVTASIDDGQEKAAAFAPFVVDFKDVPEGEHMLHVTVYGTRYNCFGAVHNCSVRTVYWGPSLWRTRGDDWSYEYQLRPQGLLSAPSRRL